MATRTQIQQLIDDNVYDNVNKEILAEMLRTVLESLKDNYYNLQEDQLANLNYSTSQTLQQVFNSIGVQKRAIIGTYSFDAAGIESVPVESDPDNIIDSVERERLDDRILVIRVTFTQNIAQNNVDAFHLIPNNLPSAVTQVSHPMKMRTITAPNQVTFVQRRTTSSSVSDHYLEIILK